MGVGLGNSMGPKGYHGIDQNHAMELEPMESREDKDNENLAVTRVPCVYLYIYTYMATLRSPAKS